MNSKTRISEEFIKKFSNNILEEDLKCIRKDFVHKRNEEYVLLSDIKRVPEEYIVQSDSEMQNSFYSYALPKLDCSFCFDHELDHLPFMMIVEIFRQIGVATSHTHHGIPLKGFKNTMDELTMNSLRFVELDVPMLITCEDKVLKQTPTLQKRMIEYKMYQNGELCATMGTNITVIKEELYDRMRTKYRIESVRETGLSSHPVTNLELLEYQY